MIPIHLSRLYKLFMLFPSVEQLFKQRVTARERRPARAFVILPPLLRELLFASMNRIYARDRFVTFY